MSFSVQSAPSGLEYNGTSLNHLFAQRTNLLRPSFHRMLRDILRFYREAGELLEGRDRSTTLGAYLDDNKYSDEFVRDHLIPMGAAVWSANPAQMREFPAQSFIRFFHNHGFLQRNDRPKWRVVRGGSQRYVEALTLPFADRIRPAARSLLSPATPTASKSPSATDPQSASTKSSLPHIAIRRCACSQTRAQPKARSSEHCATSAMRPCSTPMKNCCRAKNSPGPAGITPCRSSEPKRQRSPII